ncbi:MAG TPA: thioredoxin domain-containing protein, partial [Polyangiaceae bacterium]|nr:thioredoxin domain-containing protein [Polyangiaceae bacterium]
MKPRTLLTLAALTFALVPACKRTSTRAPEATSAGGEPEGARWALPGAPRLDSATAAKLDAKWHARAPDYKPRTRHLREDGTPKYTNRLFLESSPYLLQHAHNPVNWYPWGDEAFETAKKLGRPVLLSIGYSTCHWCHVMEEESFEDEEIARYLNENYIAIKVDREERPDVDAIYMAAVQALTGSGGWPMTTWLTTDRKPFFGGTYFPARDGDRGARFGFFTLLKRLKSEYDGSRDRVVSSSNELAEDIQRGLLPTGGTSDVPSEAILDAAARGYTERFDATWGGVGEGTKFPSSLPIRFLLRHHRRSGNPQSLRMAVITLEKMARGGIYDQVGGGFHRYSTDAHWLVPHFEKMLYDNALLVMDYLEAYQATGRQDFMRVAREILRYVDRDMTSPDGAFYSATDADSPAPGGHREEGRFFTWTPDEVREVVGTERARVVTAYYGVTAHGNFEGRNILNAPALLPEAAGTLHLSTDKVRAIIDESRELLYAARAKRSPPARDEKILSAWNGLMISAYARAALVLGDPGYAAKAARAAHFVLDRLRRDGRLLRSFKDGEAKNDGYLDDYAFTIAALLDLFELTGEPQWLREGMHLDEVLAKHYADGPNGGFFLTSDDQPKLLAREKPGYDGAEPSGNSVSALNLLRLYELTFSQRYAERADRTLAAFRTTLTN